MGSLFNNKCVLTPSALSNTWQLDPIVKWRLQEGKWLQMQCFTRIPFDVFSHFLFDSSYYVQMAIAWFMHSTMYALKTEVKHIAHSTIEEWAIECWKHIYRFHAVYVQKGQSAANIKINVA